MIEKVWAIWITGVLQPSLPHDILLDLGLTERPALVTRTLDLYVQRPDLVDQVQAPGTRLIGVFDRMDRGLLILGAPGAGKTTLLLTLAQDLLFRAAQDPDHPIPVVFPLSSWAQQRQSLAAWLVDALNEQYDVPRKTAQAWVDADQILPLLDGLDEVAPEHRAACVEVINAFRHDHGLLPMVVCSRIAEYEVLDTRLQLQGAVIMQPLTRAQVDSYLIQVGKPLAAVREALRDDPMLWELLDTPLMLTIVTLACTGEPVEILRRRGSSEEWRQHLFTAYVDRMFRRRRAVAGYTRQQTEHWLSWLAWQMGQHSQTIFYLEQVQPDYLPHGQRWLPTQGARLLAGLLGALLGGVVFGLSMWLASMLAVNIRLTTMLAIHMHTGVGAALLGGLVGCLAGYSQEIVSIESVRWSWSRMLATLLLPSRHRPISGRAFALGLGLLAWLLYAGIGLSTRAGGWLVVGLFAGLFHGLAIALSVILINRLGIILGAGLLMALRIGVVVVRIDFGVRLADRLWDIAHRGLLDGLSVGLALGLVYQVISGLSAGLSVHEITTKTNPNEGIHRSTRIALMSGLGSGLAAGLLSGLVFGPFFSHSMLFSPTLFSSVFEPSVWPLGGLLVGLTVGLRYGGRACLQHLVLRLKLWSNGSAPWHYVDFLDYAAERILLRKVGGGYSFIHRLLQDYFASLYKESGDGAHAETAGQERSARS